MASAFTVFEKFGEVCAALDEADRKELMYAICMYGMYGEEVELPYLLNAVFLSLKEDIDNSKKMRDRGSTGGRPRKAKEASATENQQVSDIDKPVVSESEKPEVSESEKPVVLANSEKCESQTKPNQTNPVQSKVCKRFRAPTPEEAEEYARDWCDQKGLVYDFNPQRFCDFYESKGWKVGRNPMKDWKAAVRTWLSDAKRKGVRKSEYSDL